MMKTLPRVSLFLAFRIVVTMLAWLVFIAIVHHLGHAYLAEIKSVLGTKTTLAIVQIAGLWLVVYLIILSLPFFSKPGLRGAVALLVWSIVLVCGHQFSHQGFHQLQNVFAAVSGEMGAAGLVLGALVYALVLALPFVPGVEFGFLLMVFFGFEGVIVAYLATVAGLSLAYFVAQAVPGAITLRWLEKLGMPNATEHSQDAIHAISFGADATRGAAARVRDFLLNHRYLGLAVGLNLPGNSVIGGGGGIAVLCGLSKQFRWWHYFLTLVLATLPVPLLVLSGQLHIESLAQNHGVLHDVLDGISGLFF